MRAVTYRYATPTDKEAILALLRTNAPCIPEELRPRLFDWQYVDANPLAKERPAFLLSEVDGVVAGVNGIMPVDIRLAGQECRVVWSCDTLVSDRFRGLGIGKGLLSKVSVEAPIVLGFGISDLSDPILAKLGWRPFNGVTTHFYYAKETGLKGRAKSVWSKVKSVQSRAIRACPEISMSLLTGRFGAAHDALWRRVENHYSYAVVRNSGYLNWRYRDHPVLNYDVLEARNDNDLAAVLVVRHDPYESVIADFVGPADNDDVLTALVRHATKFLIGRGVARIRCETSLSPMKRALNRVGFIDYPGHSVFRYFMSGTPLEHESNMNWFVMTGDSDNECSQVGGIFERAEK